jgi:hypothetical protein
MRNKLLITTATLLVGVAVASAQNIQGGGEQRGGAAAQGQPAQPSPQQGQSQQAPQSKQQGQSQRGQKGETTGQAPQGQREQGAQQGTGQSQQQREPAQGQAPQRQQGQQGQQKSQQGQTGQQGAPQQGQAQQGEAPRQGQAQQGQASGSTTLTTEQRTKVRETVLTGGNVPRVNNVNFSLSVGTSVPTRVRVVAVPPPLIEIYPQWRGHMYFVVGDQIIIVDRNHRFFEIISV